MRSIATNSTQAPASRLSPRNTASQRRAARRLPPRRVRNIRSAHLRPRRRRTEKPLRPRSLTAPPTVFDRAPGEIIPDKLTVYRRDFLLRRGARVELSRRAGTALRPRRPPLRRAGGAARHANRTCRAQFAWTARLGDSFYFAQCEIVESLLRRGARWFERTGLKPAGLRFRRGGAPKGRLIGLAGKKASAMRAVYSTKPRRGLQYHKAVFADDLDAVDGE